MVFDGKVDFVKLARVGGGYFAGKQLMGILLATVARYASCLGNLVDASGVWPCPIPRQTGVIPVQPAPFFGFSMYLRKASRSLVLQLVQLLPMLVTPPPAS